MFSPHWYCMSFHCFVWYCMVLYCIRVFCTISHCHVSLLQRAGELPRSASSHFKICLTPPCPGKIPTIFPVFQDCVPKRFGKFTHSTGVTKHTGIKDVKKSGPIPFILDEPFQKSLMIYSDERLKLAS